MKTKPVLTASILNASRINTAQRIYLAKVCACIPALLLMAGCASVERTKPVAFTPDGQHSIKRLGLLNPPSPKMIVVVDDSVFTASVNSGALGLLPLLLIHSATKSDSGKDSTAFAKSIEGIPFDIGQMLGRALADKLKVQGYEVVLVETVRPDASQLCTNYGALNVEADALLDTALVFAGFHDRAGENGYGPELVLKARLVSKHDYSTLYYGTVSFRPRQEPLSLSSDPKYLFADDKKLIEGKERALEGLRISIESAADLLSREFDTNNAVVHFHPHYGIWGAGNEADLKVMIDGRDVDIGAYDKQVAARIRPGKHRIAVCRADGSKLSSPVEFVVEPAKQYCVQMPVGAFGAISIKVLSQSEASKLHQPAKRVPSTAKQK